VRSLTWLIIADSDGSDGTRALDLDGYNNAANMTVESCVLFCMDRGYPMAGTEYGLECCEWLGSFSHVRYLAPQLTCIDCGEKVNEKFSKVDNAECSTACAGDSSEPCGAGNRLSVYTGPAGEPTPPSPIEGWAYEGCFKYVHVRQSRNRYPLTDCLQRGKWGPHPHLRSKCSRGLCC
jgi:hypothetical protein